MKNIWDRLSKNYIRSVEEDKNADFAYERLVNSLSVLSLCDNFGNALDLGCGDGRFTRELEVRYAKVCAIDYSSTMLAKSKKFCQKTTFIRADIEKDFPKLKIKFDIVICKLLLMYINDINNLAFNISKTLNRGGLLVISVTHPLKWIDKNDYLSEPIVKGQIAHDSNLSIGFKTRTLQNYINTFTKHGFRLEAVIETGVPDSFVIKYPQYLKFQNKPYRLNLKFVKQ